MKNFRPLPMPLRLISWVLILTQLGMPFANELSVAVADSIQDIAATQRRKEAQLAAATPSPAPYAVNRTAPNVQPPSSTPGFSTNPTEAELFLARIFYETLLLVGS